MEKICRLFLSKRLYTFYQKLCQTKFVDLIETNNFVNLRFFRISHIIVKKLNFGFSILLFQIKKKNIYPMKKYFIQSCRFLCSK